MTVNERLFACGLIDEVDRSRMKGDVAALREIFAKIDLPGCPVEDLLS